MERKNLLNINHLAQVFVIFSTLLAPSALARQDDVPGSRYTSGRGAGMGDAFAPLADDGASALFYNPASLGHLVKPRFEPLNFSLGMNNEFVETLNLDSINAFQLDSFSTRLQQIPQRFPGVNFQLLPNFATKGFGFGLLYSTEVAARYDGGQIRYRARYQVIPAAGFGIRLAHGVIRLGYVVQWVHTAYGDRTVAASAATGYTEGIFNGSGFSHNASIALTFPVAFLPSFQIITRNLFGTSFSNFSLLGNVNNSAGAPPDEPMTFDASFSMEPQLGRGAKVNVVVNMRDALNASNMPLLVRLAVGIELAYRNQFFARVGWGSAYPSAGIGLRRARAEFALAWYSEEIGGDYHGERDTKYMLQYQIRAF